MIIGALLIKNKKKKKCFNNIIINKVRRTASHHNSTDRPTYIMYTACVYDYNYYYLSVYDDGRYYNISRLRSYAQYYNIIKHCRYIPMFIIQYIYSYNISI